MVTIVDGKKIAKKIQNELAEYTTALHKPIQFDIVYVGSDPVIDTFVKYKQRFGKKIGVNVIVHRFDTTVTESELLHEIKHINTHSDALIIQLPLPDHLHRQTILDAVSAENDVDVLATETRALFSDLETEFLPAVAGSVVKIIEHHQIDLKDKNIVLIGNGTLVGYPLSLWLDRSGYMYDLIIKETSESVRKELLSCADIIISGAGVPHMLQPDMIKDGVVLIDAGTSESGKKVVGDIHPDCYTKASLVTPVPGGIGPMTIAILYTNIINAHKKRHA